ncbi:MAG: nitroreductase family protein [Phycisphaerae bacterium]|jgi:nitroreductase
MVGNLRAKVHMIEKQKQEGAIDEKRKAKAVKMYYLMRNDMSCDESSWCESVLFDKERLSIPSSGNIIYTRRSCRKWTLQVVTNSEFLNIVDAARWAPSGCNRQPMEFILTRDKNKIVRLSEIKRQKFIEKAPSCIIALVNMDCYKKVKSLEMKMYFCFMDAGAAIENLLLAGESLGLGMCWVNIEPKNEDEIAKLFHISYRYRVVALIPCGRSEGKTAPPGRKDLAGMVHYEEWRSR